MAGIYQKIAIPMKGGEWRKASMVLLAEGVDQVPLDEPVPSTSIPLTTTTSAGEGS